VFQYTAAENREATIDEVANNFWHLLNSAKPGGDIQLQLVNFYGRFARTAPHQENIRGILSGKIVVPGLDLGHDVRWELITGLAAGGAISLSEIDAEYAGDSTANGQKGHASASAALALADSKAAVWSKLVGTDEYSNAQSASASLAFGRALKPELLVPFVDRYFADAETIWDTKTYKMAEYLLQRLFPINLATQELADRTRAYLAANTHFSPAMRRMIVENLSRLDRALAAQVLDNKSLDGKSLDKK
jgi:aminopeptidase N